MQKKMFYVIRLSNGRFFSSFSNRGHALSAWSVLGATMFAWGRDPKMLKIIEMLEKKGRGPSIASYEAIETTNFESEVGISISDLVDTVRWLSNEL